ncbi:MAG: hypothetical protein U1A06_20580 [Hoeflea sp.]|nr:hypothetical protein [Hoeflea sp.]
MTTMIGEEIFWRNANATFFRLGMSRLDPANGAAVEIVDWCRRFRRRPTHTRQLFLERESPEILAYLEALDADGSPAAWRTLDERINRAVREYDMRPYPCGWPWHVGIWLLLPELAAIGRKMLQEQERANGRELEPVPVPIQEQDDGDKGSGDKSGSAGTTAKRSYLPLPRLRLPVAAVVFSEIERKIFGIDDGDGEDDADANPQNGFEGPDEPIQPVNQIGGTL